MTTSNSTNFTINRDALITASLRIIGVISQGQTPTSTMITEGAEALNMLVKAWEADGMPLWAIKQYSITPVTGTTSYRIGMGQTVATPKPLRILSAYYHNSVSNIDIPMTLLTRNEYNMLGNKVTSGRPIQFYYDVQREYGDLFLFPTPDSTVTGDTIVLVYQRPFEDFDASTDEPDFPQEWFQALKFGLAEVLAPEYGVPLENYGYLRKVAKEYKDAALSNNTEEGSFFFHVDHRKW